MPRLPFDDSQGVGRWLYYRERGQGPLLVILPGNTASSACHQGELAYWSDRFHSVSPDFLGTGQSDRVASWVRDWWRSGARQVRALLDHLSSGTCTVMGTSGGAVVALWTAILYPDRVRAVVADSCVARFPPEMLDNLNCERARPTPDQIAFWRGAHGDDWEQVIEADTELIQRFVGRGGDWFGPRLGEIQCPVLLTASMQDSALPQVAQQNGRMAEQIADCRLYLHNEGGHPLMWSRPQDFRYIVDHFLEGLAS